MNISYNWLKQYIDFDLAPEELSAALTSIGLETGGVEEVESIPGGMRGVVIGKVLTCEMHPNSDHLHITTVDLGDGQPVQIVCGAPNVAAGQTVVVATVGSCLYFEGQKIQIKKSKIRGVESMGMICAEDEIGIGSSHEGIIVIDEDLKPGTKAADYYDLKSDFVLEVDLTPNRVDASSHYGVARDLKAWMMQNGLPCDLHRPRVETYSIDSPDNAVEVEVLSPEDCPRYSGVTIRNIKVSESPKWLKERLEAIGQRPINNIVDITNYILHAMGQPLHCFDADLIGGGRIQVRKCPKGTPFVTLDGVQRELDGNDLMICDSAGPMCIAGVFGGLNSGVTQKTTSIFLESAYFNPTSIRKTARRHGLSTDASFRYERGVDPNGTLYALKYAMKLVRQLAGGIVCGEIVDIYPNEIKPFPVTLSYAYLNSLVGKEIPQETVDDILRSLEIEILDRREGEVDLAVPTYRVDVRRPCDVVEDVLRIYGYNNVEIKAGLHASLSYKTFTESANELAETVSNQLTAAGFNEIMNNSLTAESYYEGEAYPMEKCVRLLNPLSGDLSVLRQTLLFGGLESLSHNINRKLADLKMYEIGNVYFRDPDAASTAENPLAPYSETSRLGIWMTGAMRKGNWLRKEEEVTFYDLKATVENLFLRLGIPKKEITHAQGESPIYGSSIEIKTKSGKKLGAMGIVSKSLLKRFNIKQEVFYAELDWSSLVKASLRKSVTYSSLPKTQPVERDLALLLDKSVTMAQVEALVRQSEHRLLKDVALFDVYEGENLPEGKKSYAISITLQDEEKTLQDKQIEAVMEKIISNLKKSLGASLR